MPEVSVVLAVTATVSLVLAGCGKGAMAEDTTPTKVSCATPMRAELAPPRPRPLCAGTSNDCFDERSTWLFSCPRSSASLDGSRMIRDGRASTGRSARQP
jgi:hypothetical protein